MGVNVHPARSAISMAIEIDAPKTETVIDAPQEKQTGVMVVLTSGFDSDVGMAGSTDFAIGDLPCWRANISDLVVQDSLDYGLQIGQAPAGPVSDGPAVGDAGLDLLYELERGGIGLIGLCNCWRHVNSPVLQN
jgi:hypothetical protein